MSYTSLDPILKSWALCRAIPLATEFKNEGVRSFEIVGENSKCNFQIWIDPPNANGVTIVRAWDRKKWKFSHESTLFHLKDTLDKALSEIHKRDVRAERK